MSIFAELDQLNAVGHTLRWIRTTHNLSVEQVADAAHIDRQHLRDIETQSVTATPPQAALITATIEDLHAGKARLHCQHCDTYVTSVHAPAPPVPITCPACKTNSACSLDSDIAAETIHHTATIALTRHNATSPERTVTVTAETIRYTDGLTETSVHIYRDSQQITVDLHAARRLRDELAAAIAAAESFPRHAEHNTP